MPKFFKQNLLSSPLDTPELPRDDEEAREWEQQPHHTHQAHAEPEDFYPYMDELEIDPVKTLLEWHAPSRPFRKKDRSFYTYATVLVVLLSLIALFAGQLLLIVALLAFLFLIYVLNFVPPVDAHFKISTQGVTIDDHFYHWQQLDSFWFTEKDDHKLLHILTHLRFPGIVMMVLGDTDEEEVKKAVARYLPFHEIAPKTMMDKWSETLQKHFPLENPHKISV